MSVDLEAIAQRGRCDVSSLQLARPLLEQGYTPPFLARYRRDELGGLDESTLWALSAALQIERDIAQRRDEMRQAWEQTPLKDPSIGQAINKSNSQRMLTRLTRRVKVEAHDSADDATRLAVRILNPQKGDGNEVAAIAAKVDGIGDAEAAVAGLDAALTKRLCEDPRIVAAAVRWFGKNARIHIASISDPHTAAAEEASQEPSAGEAEATTTSEPAPAAEAPTEPDAAAAPETVAATPETSTDATDSTTQPSEPSAEPPASGADESSADSTAPEAAATPTETPSEDAATDATDATESTEATPSDGESESVAAEATPAAEASATDSGESTEQAATSTEGESTPAAPAEGTAANPESAKTKTAGKGKGAGKAASKGKPKQKKVSPRQRRRRWLVGVLKPLEGKKFNSDKLSSFQIVMLGRALRSQVATCAFEYDATKLVADLQRTAAGINRQFEQQLRDLVLKNEAAIREAAESAWWDDLQQRASTRLVTVTADHLRKQMDRGGVPAKVVMSIDAIGPRTAATSIVSADGRLLHSEDLPCQLSSALRSQAVAKMGELIHTYHVDLLIVSNGPARRATMAALGDLIAQSPDHSIRWTLADRSGADAYASSQVADLEMRSTPRRFRAAAWLAFSILHPAQALAKVDPLKLRLSSFQRELSDEATEVALRDVMISGASRGGVDVNSAPLAWLERLPGVTPEVAKAIDTARRDSLFASRSTLGELEAWDDAVNRRQALPFLRVFGGEEVLDGTLIHPDDYPLAKKLAAALEIELPPSSPPGYKPPDFTAEEPPAAELAETKTAEAKPEVEEFTSAGEQAGDFDVDAGQPPAEADDSSAAEQPPAAETADESVTNAAEPAPESAESSEPESAGDESAATAEAESSAEATSDDDASAAAAETEGEEKAAEAEPSEAASAEARPEAPEVPEPIRRPRPEKAKIDKCVKEWQIGARRAHQLVYWLCDPFGDGDSSGVPPAVLSTMPTAKSLKQGDQVIGVVVGVMPFGVFVELAPDCSGLIHVSRVSDSYIDDLHEAVQVGDVVTAWVTGIDEKRRRVALSAVSPEREAELEQAKRSRDERPRRGGPRQRGGGEQRGGGRGQQRSGENRGRAAGGGGEARGGKGGGQGGRGKDQARGGRDSQRGGRGRDGGRGGRPRDGRGGGRGREKKPESYRVVSKQEAKPITDAMQKGEEPMRSFGDLMQFFDKSKSPEPEPPKEEPKATESTPPESTSDTPASESAAPAADTAGETPQPAADPAPPASEPTADTGSPDASAGESSGGEPKPDSSDNQPPSRADASTQ